MVRRFLTEVEVADAIGMLQGGFSQSDVARQLRVYGSVIHRAFQRFQATGQFSARSRSGRLRATTQRQDRYTVKAATLCGRQKTAIRPGICHRNQFPLKLWETGFTRWLPFTPTSTTGPPESASASDSSQLDSPTCKLEAELVGKSSFYWWVQFQFGFQWWASESLEPARGTICGLCYCRTWSIWGGSLMVSGGIWAGGRTDLVLFRRGTLNAERYLNDGIRPQVIL